MSDRARRREGSAGAFVRAGGGHGGASRPRARRSYPRPSGRVPRLQAGSANRILQMAARGELMWKCRISTRSAAAVRPNTRLVWVETPSNPLLKITDLKAVAEIARKANAISVCDGTFTTPILQRPFLHGIDMVMHSTTKYISGHSDVVGGALITKFDNYLFERVRNAQRHGGAVPSPFDCWLTLRGVSTLPCRMRAHLENAAAIAAFLSAHSAVEQVHYPGLSTHAGHDLARQSDARIRQACSRSQIQRRVVSTQWTSLGRCDCSPRATSLGGPHSFAEHRASAIRN